MKLTLAIAALVANTQAITLYTMNGQIAYQGAGELEDVSLLQMEKPEEYPEKKEYFHAGATGMLGEKEYTRVVPARYASDNDDIFMRSMIQNYALELKTKEGLPTGKFFMNPATTRAAAEEVLTTHKGLKGAALEDYLKTYFDKAWGHFDVNRTGIVEVIKMPMFMRFLSSDQYMSLQPE
jgi:hypothetical protein